MRIAVDENVVGAREAFGQFGDVITFAGRELCRDDLREIDAIVVRSVTRVDASLLAGTPVRFVGTATIGTDHLDLPWLAQNDIAFADAAGSNTRSVAEYVLAAILELDARGLLDAGSDAIGVVGVGRIGTIVADIASALGMRVVAYDPPRARLDRTFRSASSAELFDCRIITLHVPLTLGCRHPTWHLVDATFLERMRSDGVLVNTSRGPVVHRGDLVAALHRRMIATTVVDVWEGEPDVPRDLIERAALATPHIAGYSLDGKARGTAMIADALARWLRTANAWSPESVAPADEATIVVDPTEPPHVAARSAMRRVYDIRRDDGALRALLDLGELERRAGFDVLRRHYPKRRENRCFRIEGGSEDARDLLQRLGFQLDA